MYEDTTSKAACPAPRALVYIVWANGHYCPRRYSRPSSIGTVAWQNYHHIIDH